MSCLNILLLLQSRGNQFTAVETPHSVYLISYYLTSMRRFYLQHIGNQSALISLKLPDDFISYLMYELFQ